MALKPAFNFGVANLVNSPALAPIAAHSVEDHRPKKGREDIHGGVLPAPRLVDQPVHHFIAQFCEKDAIQRNERRTACSEKKLHSHVNCKTCVNVRERIGSEIIGDHGRNHDVPFKSAPRQPLSRVDDYRIALFG